ncbi:MAG: 16S rRNA (guanine(966)-N(2))-methyltransferase RsmD [Corynebacteriales bacterium]|nr:16S rRNA (guanine(966)-N(2))-methyltransferase RsmD [Mycobacteriales bacterium]
MTRIIAGVAGGRRIEVPQAVTRPTADRAREALFSSIGAEVDRAGFLDLYAGSGAVGLEAASRGAKRVLLVESHAKAGAVLRRNISAVGLSEVKCVISPVERLVEQPSPEPFDIVFLDPPYALSASALNKVLMQLSTNNWLVDEALVIVERASRDAPWQWPVQYVPLRDRRYGEGTLWYGRHSDVRMRT